MKFDGKEMLFSDEELKENALRDQMIRAFDWFKLSLWDFPEVMKVVDVPIRQYIVSLRKANETIVEIAMNTQDYRNCVNLFFCKCNNVTSYNMLKVKIQGGKTRYYNLRKQIIAESVL